jgi:hypothetical protein
MAKGVIVLVFESPKDDLDLIQWSGLIAKLKENLTQDEADAIETVWTAVNEPAQKVINVLEENPEDL